MTYEVIIFETYYYKINKKEFDNFNKSITKQLTCKCSSNLKISKFYKEFESIFIKKYNFKYEKNYSLNGNALVIKVKSDLNDTFEQEIIHLAEKSNLSIHIQRPDTNNTTALRHSFYSSKWHFMKMYDEFDEY